MTYRAKRQKGVALLLALGFLSLLLVSGIAFVANATVARKAAANSRARAQARTIAQAAVNRLLSEIRYTLKHPSDGYVAPAEMTSAANGTFSEGGDDTSETLKGENSLLSAYVYGEKYIPENIYKDAARQPKWEFWYDSYNSDGTKKAGAAIIGRSAFMALQATASVNLSEVLRGADFGDPTGTWSRWNARRGASMRELYINADFITSSLYNRFKDERFADNDLGQDTSEAQKAANYQDYDALFTAANLNDTTDPGSTKRNWLQSWVLPGGYNEPEIFAFNTDGNTSAYNDKTDFFHRFNLARRTTDDKSVWDSEAGTARVTVGALLGNPVKFDAKETAPAPSTALPWLKCIKGDDASHDATYTAEVLRKQVAANLIDYCDSDSVATSDSTDWETTAPTYTGNEKTPYINEIMISPSICVRREERKILFIYKYSYTCTIDLRMVAAEVVNIYKNEFPASLNMALKGEFTIDISVDGDKYKKKDIKVSFDIPMQESPTAWSPGAESPYAYKILYNQGGGADPNPVTASGGATTTESSYDLEGRLDPVSVKATITNFKISKIHLKTADGSVDYVRELDFTADPLESTLTADAAEASRNMVTQYPHIGCEVDDPRNNLYQRTGTSVNWRVVKAAAVSSTVDTTNPKDVAGFTFGAKNAFCNPAAAGDQEDFGSFTDGALLSTAFIADAPMKTLAELGTIHRGEKWRTINLKCGAARIWHSDYDPLRNSAESTGYTYADGDAAILDQVKLTKDAFSAGKVNLNRYPGTTSENYLFKALFENIGWNVQFANQYLPADVDIDASVRRVTSGQAETLRNALGASGRATLLSRGHMVDFLKDTAGFLQGTTDVQKEIIPAASAGLTSSYVSNPDIIQFVVVAQSVLDVGTPDGVSMNKLSSDGSSLVEMNVKKGQFDRKSGIYFDEIAGEVKMLVTVQINALEQTVKLLKTEFLD